MKVLVIGANGQVGKHIVRQLTESEHDPVAMVRDTNQVPQFEDMGAKTVLADLENDFSHAFYGCDAVIFAAGSGPHTGADKTILIDQEGAIKSIDYAKQFGVKHFVMLGSMGSDAPEKGPDSMKFYLYAKRRADEYLKTSGLNYTIIRPGALTNTEPDGKVDLRENVGDRTGRSIPRADVARVLVESVGKHNVRGKTLELLEGEKDIGKAVESV
ncbi:SDR family oxidoreductase [Bacillus marinisedimentorum]|uniref:SDR family oxidoreductase n=1 Tax=Bacillus marinisedimentorum TaxID=1821260 RepID=UPI000871EE88|nr:SDR family oxidoreductase [Bacillus marinisedimentorum]